MNIYDTLMFNYVMLYPFDWLVCDILNPYY